MPSRYKPNCNTCKKTKLDAKLRQRIQNAAYKRDIGDESLAEIAKEIGVTIPTIYNHVKKHITDDDIVLEKRLQSKRSLQAEKIKAKVQKDLELKLDVATVEEIDSDPLQILGLKEYIAQGNDMIKKGGLKITAQSYLVAVRTLNEFEAKKTNNKLEFLRTIAAFRGGKKELIDPTKVGEETESGDRPTGEITESTHRGPGRPRRIRGEVVGDATARWAEEVLEANTVE